MDEEKIKQAVVGEGEIEEKKTKKKSKDEKEPEKEEMKITDIPGIGPGSAAKLEAAGVYDLMGLAVMGPVELAELAGLGEAAARKAIQAARKMMNLGFSDGLEFAKKREEVFHITTGSKNLNNLLGGRGIETKAITEAYGAFGSGKCVSKDTSVCYFNDTRMHVECIEDTYNKYNKGQESKTDEGFAVPVQTVKVLAWSNGELSIVPASYLYKEKVKQLYVVKTKRGRVLKVTGKHQLLGFDGGVSWRKSSELKKGDLIASPKKIELVTETLYDEDDAYFLGIFAAEGSFNPFSISNNSKKLKDWICEYIERKFGYMPTVKIDNRRPLQVYTILLRDKTRVIMDGLDKCNSSDKFIPEGIFLSSESIILSFLGGYFDGDGEVSSNDISATTKSKKLATQLTYLLLRLGISASISEKKVDDKDYKIVRISGEDRERLKSVKFLVKKFNPNIKNSSYGYPRQIIGLLSELYKESIGGNRGNLRKFFGKYNNNSTAYKNLTNSSSAKVINSGTLDSIEEIFCRQKEEYLNILKFIEKEEFSSDILRQVYPKLPFAFNSLSEKLGIKKSSIRNYYSRNIPNTKKEILKNLIVNELKTRVDTIFLALALVGEIKTFAWDSVESVDVIDYDDFVYDFVVPEGHSFIGGNMPTMMHNTQLALSLTVNVQLPIEKGGANGKAVFIDTEGTFRPERIRQFAEGVGADPTKVLKNILVARAFNSDHQILLLDRITEMIKEGEPIRLIVIDSLTAHFRAEFAGRGQLADRQQKLNKYLHNLMKLAEQHNVAVYVTNQVMANPAMMFGDPTTAVGGNIVGHACLTGDSLIQLGDGRIKEIKNMGQEQVISGKLSALNLGKAKSDLVFINPSVEKVYNIKTNNQINCSPLHRFFTVNNFSIVEKEAKDLKEGEFVMQAGKITIEGEEQKLPLINVKRIGRISKEDAIKIEEELEKTKETREKICEKIGITPRQFRRVINQNWPTSFNVLENLQNQFSGRLQLQMIPVQTYKHRGLAIPQIMSPQLAQICGYFLGDGNLETRGLRFRDAREEVLQVYSSLFKEVFKIEGKISKMSNKNCYTLSVNSKEVSELFKIMIPEIVNYIGKSADNVVGAFIKGFVDAEGHIDKKRALITIAQKEKQILRYLQLFMLRFGIRSTIKFDIGQKKMSVLRIIARDVKNYMRIGFTAKDKQDVLITTLGKTEKTYEKEMTPIKRSEVWSLLTEAGVFASRFIKPRGKEYNWISRKELENVFNALMNQKIEDRQIKQKIDFIQKILNSDIRFEKIREINIKENNSKELFYDFSVPENQNYIADGFIVHNSTYRMYFRKGKKDTRVAKLIDSPNLPDNETVFMITEAGLKDVEI